VENGPKAAAGPTPRKLAHSISLFLGFFFFFIYICSTYILANGAPQLLTNMSQASGDNVVHFEPMVHKHGLITTSAGLHFEATTHHFIEGKMIVKCSSNLSLRKSDNPFQQNAPSLDNKEAMMYSEYSVFQYKLQSNAKDLQNSKL
jgi:hypothetical protein